MNRSEIKAMAEAAGVKKPAFKSDYNEAFYAFTESLVERSEGRFRRLRDEAEKLRLKGKGDGKITVSQLTEVLNEQH